MALPWFSCNSSLLFSIYFFPIFPLFWLENSMRCDQYEMWNSMRKVIKTYQNTSNVSPFSSREKIKEGKAWKVLRVMSKLFVCSVFQKPKGNRESPRMCFDCQCVSLDFWFLLNSVLIHSLIYVNLQVVQIFPWEIVMLFGVPINQTPSRCIQRQKVIY